MSALRGVKPQSEFFVVRTLCFTVLLAFFAHAPGTFGQEPTSGSAHVAENAAIRGNLVSPEKRRRANGVRRPAAGTACESRRSTSGNAGTAERKGAGGRLTSKRVCVPNLHIAHFSRIGTTRILQFGGFSVWHPDCGNASRQVQKLFGAKYMKPNTQAGRS